ncbi:MAG: hypothetical protein ABEK12_04270 [Candidatus Nanohaloarchaea archaeon]
MMVGAEAREPVWPLLVATILILVAFVTYLYLRLRSGGVPFLPPPTARADETA